MGHFGGSYDLAVGLCYLFLSILGSVGNLYTVVVIGRTRWLYNHCTPFLLSLAIGNLLCCLTTIPIVSYTALTFKPEDYPIGGHIMACKLLSLELHTLFGVSYGTLAAISIVRCMVVWTNGNSPFLGRWHLGFLLLFTWTFPAIFSIPLFVAYGTDAHSGRICAYFCGASFNKSEEEVWAEERLHWEVWEMSEVFTVITYPGVPLLVMAVSYSLIFYQMRSSRLLLEECGVLAFNVQKREQNFSRMLCYIFLSHLICCLPAAILHFNDRTSILFWPSAVPDWLNSVSFVLLVTPFATNPLIYVASDPNYRRAYRDTILCRCAAVSLSSNKHPHIWTSPMVQMTRGPVLTYQPGPIINI